MLKTAAQDAYSRYREKLASTVTYDAYGNPVSSSQLPVLAPLLGAGFGGVTAHMLPTEEARALRELAKQIPDDIAAASAKGPAKWSPGVKHWPKLDYSAGPGKHTRFRAPAHVAKQFLKSKAMAANAPRLLAGLGLGAAGGYLANKFME